MTGNAEVILVRKDGSIILQIRDNKPGIANPGLITAFGGHIEPGEEPVDAALREINEETNLNLTKDRLEFFGLYHKTKAVHGEDWDVYYFIARGINEEGLEVYEGTGYTVVSNQAEIAAAKASILVKQVLKDYFDRITA
jgi:8-oxo-dGTP pyrophosphatase MutT (NUDIX family)